MNKINRIIIFNLDSFSSVSAIREIIDEFCDKIVLICSSERYGGKYGSFLHQFRKNLKRSGLLFVIYLSLNHIWYHIFIVLFDFFNLIFFRQKRIYSLRQLAKKYNIPIIKTKEINNPDVIALIKEKNPDLIISSFFDHVIGKEIIAIPKLGIINIHTALLPKCKGPFPILCTLLKNEKAGITIHYVDEKLDTGDIIKQKYVDLDANKSILTLDREMMEIGAEMAIEVIKNLEERANLNGKIQENQGYYMSYPFKKDIAEIKSRNIKLFSIWEFLKFFKL